jgi:hypothetical protein
MLQQPFLVLTMPLPPAAAADPADGYNTVVADPIAAAAVVVVAAVAKLDSMLLLRQWQS